MTDLLFMRLLAVRHIKMTRLMVDQCNAGYK